MFNVLPEWQLFDIHSHDTCMFSVFVTANLSELAAKQKLDSMICHF